MPQAVGKRGRGMLPTSQSLLPAYLRPAQVENYKRSMSRPTLLVFLYFIVKSGLALWYHSGPWPARGKENRRCHWSAFIGNNLDGTLSVLKGMNGCSPEVNSIIGLKCVGNAQIDVSVIPMISRLAIDRILVAPGNT